MRKPVAITALLALGLLPTLASGHELNGFVSDSGLSFIERTIPTMVPDHVDLAEIEKVLYDCDGDDDMTATQRDTAIDLTIHDFGLSVPDDGRLRVELTVSAQGDGEMQLRNHLFCQGGNTTCGNDFMVDNGTVIMEFGVAIEDGKPKLEVHDIDIDMDAFDFNLDGCSLAGAANYVTDFGVEYFGEALLYVVERLAKEKIGPLLGEMMVGFNGVQGELQDIKFDAQLAKVDINTDRVLVGGDVDFSSAYEAATCIRNDPGEPSTHSGAAPVVDMGNADVGLQVNLGLIDDVAYHVWRRGLACVNERSIADLGVELHLEDMLGAMIPGFPAGTKFGMDIRLASPPRVEGARAQGRGLNLFIEALEVDVVGTRPNGTTGSLHVELDAQLEAGLNIDPATNSVKLAPGGVTISRLTIDDQIQASEAGFDAAQIRMVLQDYVLPHALEGIADKPLTGPIFGMEGFYVILRDANIDSSYLDIQADLFKAPDVDNVAPDTSIEDVSDRPVSVKDARIVVSGTDDLIPTELLRYQVAIDGAPIPGEPSFVREYAIGEVGKTQTYAFSVSALDLAGNVDTSPAYGQITVDGIAPKMVIDGGRVRDVDGTVDLSWSASDDLTAAGQLSGRVEVYRLKDGADPLSAQLVQTLPVAAGVSAVSFSLQSGSVYRAEIYIQDEAGNSGTQAATLITPGARSGGGCSTGGETSTGAMILLAAALIALRRRETASVTVSRR